MTASRNENARQRQQNPGDDRSHLDQACDAPAQQWPLPLHDGKRGERPNLQAKENEPFENSRRSIKRDREVSRSQDGNAKIIRQGHVA